jgi:hypothetical protein
MAWVIPLFLAYIPGLVIAFMASTLIVSPYHGLDLDPLEGAWGPSKPTSHEPTESWASHRAGLAYLIGQAER